MRFLSSAFFAFLITFSTNAQPFLQEASRPGQTDFFQRILDLQGNFDVMMISLKPGYEDASAIAYFRLGRGAKVLSVYISNGEGGAFDGSSLYPHEIAARLRENAFRVTQALDCDIHFMNMPDLVAASDTSHVRAYWSGDTLISKLRQLLLRFRPDMVLVPGDPDFGDTNPQLNVLHKDLLAALRALSTSSPVSVGQWAVNRVFLDDGSGKGIALDSRATHPYLKKRYESIGADAMRTYGPRVPGFQNTDLKKRSYTLIHSRSRLKPKKLDEGLPLRASSSLRPLELEIEKLTRDLSKRNLARMKTSMRDSYLKSIARIMQSVDQKIPRAAALDPFELKYVSRWKAGLENLRNALLGVSISCSLSETVLAPRQVTFLKIDSLSGIHAVGTTEIYFPTTQQGWIVNEDFQQRLPLKLHETYSLLSPTAGSFELPYSTYGLGNEKFVRPFYFLIIHRSKKPEFNFVYRQTINVFHAPKFTVEVLTPLVRARDGEKLLVRLSNHSRDGVKDSIFVEDSLVMSDKAQFRLTSKGMVSDVTLTLKWNGALKDSSYLFPVVIADNEMAHFVARKFDLDVDASISLGVIPAFSRSPLLESLRRLNIEHKIVNPDSMPPSLSAFGLIIVDQRALGKHGTLFSHKKSLDDFVTAGGHLIVLSQDAATWNRSKLWDTIRLEPTLQLDPACDVVMDTASSLFTVPHRMEPDEWKDWLYCRGFNTVQLTKPAHVLLKGSVGGKDYPLIISEKVGSGRRTYVDLNLDHQWLNIHEGAFRLLVNLISFDYPSVRTQ